jgi:anti-anti-sigma factor
LNPSVIHEELQRGPVFRREIEARSLIVSPHGPLGNFQEAEIIHETDELAKLIDRLQPSCLVVDLQHGDYIGSAMVGALIRLGKRVARRGARMALCQVSEQVFQILRVTKLHSGWPIYGERSEALRALAGDQPENREKPLPR